MIININQALDNALRHYRDCNFSEAEDLCRKILFLDPKQAHALYLLGMIAYRRGQYHGAIEFLRRAIAINGSKAEFHNDIGEMYRLSGNPEEAAACYHRALSLRPAYPEAHNNLGTVQRNVAEAIACYRRALALRPDYAEAHYNLGNAYRIAGNVQEAVERYQRALVLRPDFVDACHNLGNALVDQGRLQEARACYQRALALKPANDRVHSALLFGMAYADADPQVVAGEYQRWNDLHARPFAEGRRPHSNNREAQRRLRVGYVSGDFREHPISYFVEPLLSAHDHANVEVFCYSSDVWVDATTERLRKTADIWRSIAGAPDEQVADLIVADGIDILVDLSGHTGGHRLLMFARRPAPVQVTYLGSLTTTGLSEMDYKLSDRFLSPPGTLEWFSEELISLPACFVCYRPPVEAPPVNPLPASASGCVTFGSFNNLTKVTPTVVDHWSQILLRVPEARIILKDRNFADSAQKARFLDLFIRNGIDMSRIELLPRTSIHDYIALYGRIDIGLDPFPYNGCTTTCDALWMGVPVITLAGVMSYSRFGVSLLSNIGLGELIATTPEAYVEKAVALAKDLDRLATLRGGLRARMAASPLCDAKTFTRGVEDAYRIMWRRWCHS